VIGPTVVVDVDGAGVPRPAGARDVHVLLVRHGAPIAWLPLAGAPDPVHPAAVVPLLDDDAVARLASPAPCAVSSAAAVTVAVCTRDRAEPLARALARLHALSPAPAELLVVDSASRGPDVAAAAVAANARCVRVDAPGLSRARNAALAHARTPWVAFTDDDAEAAPGWAGAMAAAAARGDAACVLGPVVPVGIATPAQRLFECYGGLNRGFDARTTGREFLRGLQSPPTWRLGAGASMAVHRERALELGGFDQHLGAGVAAACSEDSDFCYRLLRAGGTIRYEPAAWVMHHHRSTTRELRRQLFGYGRGHAAAQWKAFVEYGDRRALGRLALGLPLLQARRALASLLRLSPFPLSLIAAETAGQLLGPWSWRRTRRAT
jgi:GT2 family glycosyltransferase